MTHEQKVELMDQFDFVVFEKFTARALQREIRMWSGKRYAGLTQMYS